MKTILITLSLLLAVCVNGQTTMPIDSATKLITYSDVIKVEGMTAEQLYLKSKEWISKNFTSSKNVLDLDDNKGYKIIGKWVTPVEVYGNFGKQDGGFVSYNITLIFKDGRYKYIITDFKHDLGGRLESVKPECGTFLMYMKSWKYIHEQTDNHVKNLIDSLVTFMNTKGTSDGW